MLVRNFVETEQALDHVRTIYSSLDRWINSAKLEVVELRNALLFLKVGVIDPFILDREEVVRAIDNANIGYKIRTQDTDELYKAGTLGMYTNATSKTIFVIIRIPVADKETADLFSITRIPQIQGNSKVIISHARKFLLLAKDRRMYWKGDLFEHHRVGRNIIGKAVPWSAIRENASCEVAMFQFGKDSNCDYINWNNEWNVEMVTNEGFLLVASDQKEVKYVCDKENGSFTFNQPTLVKTTPDCKLKGEDFELERVDSDREVDLGDLLIKIQCCSTFTFTEERKEGANLTQIRLNNFTNIDTQVDELHKEIKKYQEMQFKTMVISVGPLLVVMIISIIVWVIWTIQRAKARALVDRAYALSMSSIAVNEQ